MRWITKLFRRQPPTVDAAPIEQRIPTVRMPPGYPELETFRKPGARGESNIPRAKDAADYNRRMRRRFAQTAEFNRERAISLGITDVYFSALRAYEKLGGTSWSLWIAEYMHGPLPREKTGRQMAFMLVMPKDEPPGADPIEHAA